MTSLKDLKHRIFSINISLIFLIFQAITRLALSIYAIINAQISLLDLPIIFFRGLFNDIDAACYLLIIACITDFIAHKLLPKRVQLLKIVYLIGYLLIINILILNLLAEVIFWDEFGTKFNFIAVDYLIYTGEIIGTLKESLPFYEITVAIIFTGLITTYLLRKAIFKRAVAEHQIKSKLKIIGFSMINIFICAYINDINIFSSSNRYINELAQNGLYQLFSAYFNNSLDYDKFYPTIERDRALEILKTQIKQTSDSYYDNTSIARKIVCVKDNDHKPNVIILVVESLSAEFMNKFGNPENLTPNLDKLADQSIFFTNIYASGTRTVRGLEAITLSIPPTPGSSIIRRPDNSNLYNISSEFKRRDYRVNFIFGGFSYFDNLKSYFSGNHYDITDRSNLSKEEISFANIWGVADEDIFNKSIKIFSQQHNSGKPFFSLIMTTSNHRPYTFPEGKIDLPSGGGRKAAVKYADYAIGKFIENAKEQSWFDDTIFIITADHCASSAGKTNLPVNKYHIPLMIYAPKIVAPRVVDNLASQIDIAPTLMGLLQFNYNTKFFGSDIINNPPNRAFISTYQLLGLIRDKHLVILAPKKSPTTYRIIDANNKIEIDSLADLTEQAISYYMLASDLYTYKRLKEFTISE